MNLPGIYPIFSEKWKNYQTCWIISDTHFNDEEVKGFSNRPTDEEFVKKINSKVGRNDILIVLGDVGDTEYIKQIRGYKILIAGNHDAGRTNYERQKNYRKFDKDKYQRDEAILEMQRMFPNCYYTVSEGYDFHSPFEYWEVCADNKLFDEVYSGPLMIGEKLMLSHEPLDIKWAFNLHGHVHSHSHKNDKYHFNCCAEAINFSPINFNQWMKMGYIAGIESIHRSTIDTATIRKAKRIKKGK